MPRPFLVLPDGTIVFPLRPLDMQAGQSEKKPKPSERHRSKGKRSKRLRD